MTDLTVDQLRSVPPAALEAHLADAGFERQDTNLRSCTVWRPTQIGAPQIVVPENPEFDDFLARLADAIRMTSDLTGTAVPTLVHELIMSASDVIRFHSDFETPPDGSIPLGEGVDTFAGIRQALRASAKASQEKRPYYGNLYWKQAKAFLQRARLGQTERGSYVVTVLARVATPSTAAVGDQITAPGMTSTDRATLFTLLNALEATQSAVDTYRHEGDIGAFYDVVQKGVSADLCDAVIRLTKSELHASVEVSARWSPLARVTDDDVPTIVSFVTRDVEALTEASKALRATEVVPKARIRGWVEQLSRAEEGVGPGVATIMVEGGQVTRGSRVRAELDTEDYSAAIAAHDDGSRLHLEGDLSKEGNRYWLHNGRVLPSGT